MSAKSIMVVGYRFYLYPDAAADSAVPRGFPHNMLAGSNGISFGQVKVAGR